MGCAIGSTKANVKPVPRAIAADSFATEGLAQDTISDVWQLSTSVPEDEALKSDVLSGSAPSSRSPSVRSLQSGLTSLHSRPYMSSVSKSTAREDFNKAFDLQSDVPTISESIADMQDFYGIDDSARTPSFLHDHLSTSSSSGHGGLPPVIVDMRQHPLAPVIPNPSSSSTCNADVLSLDLGRLSEVPSPVNCDERSWTSACTTHEHNCGGEPSYVPQWRRSARKLSCPPRAVAPPPCTGIVPSQADTFEIHKRNGRNAGTLLRSSWHGDSRTPA